MFQHPYTKVEKYSVIKRLLISIFFLYDYFSKSMSILNILLILSIGTYILCKLLQLARRENTEISNYGFLYGSLIWVIARTIIYILYFMRMILYGYYYPSNVEFILFGIISLILYISYIRMYKIAVDNRIYYILTAGLVFTALLGLLVGSLYSSISGYLGLFAPIMLLGIIIGNKILLRSKSSYLSFILFYIMTISLFYIPTDFVFWDNGISQVRLDLIISFGTRYILPVFFLLVFQLLICFFEIMGLSKKVFYSSIIFFFLLCCLRFYPIIGRNFVLNSHTLDLFYGFYDTLMMIFPVLIFTLIFYGKENKQDTLNNAL
jgi:hypothetical protein